MQDINQEENQLFPEDQEARLYGQAPKVDEKKFFLKRFYNKYQNPIDFLVFSLITLGTTITVSFSIYIIIIKYF